MVNKRRAYYEYWYAANRDRVLKQKRDFYIQNTEYRLRVLLGRRLNAALEMFRRFISGGTIYVRSYDLSRFIGADTRLIPELIPVKLYLKHLATFVSREGSRGRKKKRHDKEGDPTEEG